MPRHLPSFENLDIVEYRKSHCLATEAQIARKFGKSKQKTKQAKSVVIPEQYPEGTDEYELRRGN